jgi:hypothetical protein
LGGSGPSKESVRAGKGHILQVHGTFPFEKKHNFPIDSIRVEQAIEIKGLFPLARHQSSQGLPINLLSSGAIRAK